MPGIRTELVIEASGACPVASASAEASGTLSEITWTEGTDGSVTEQFTAREDLEGFESVFDYGRQRIYEFDRETDGECACERIQTTVGPVTEVRARDGDLTVALHTSDVSEVRALVEDLRERFGSVRLSYLVRSAEREEADLVPVDLRRLTERQREVIRTAYRMGYFEYPRDANARQVADRLGIEQSTFAEHLAAAQGKLLAELLGEPSAATND